LNSWFPRSGGACFDTGLHALTNFVPPEASGAPLNRILRQLRIRRGDLNLLPQSTSAIQFPGCSLLLNNDFQAFRAQIEELFPGEVQAFARLLERIEAAGYSGEAPDGQSARGVMTECGIGRRLQDMLAMPVMYYGNTMPGDMVFGDFATMFKSVVREGFARPAGGMKAFLRVLTDKLEANGGVLALGNGISSLEVSGGRVTGAVDSRGERHTASHFISTVGALESAVLLGEAAPPLLKKARPGEMGFVEALVELKAPPAALGFPHCVAFVNLPERFEFAPPSAPGELPESVLICAPGNYQGSDESSLLRISAITRTEWWFGCAEDEYRARKAAAAEKCLEFLGRYDSRLAADARCIDFFTPRTIKRFTGHADGVLYGSPDKLRDFRSGLENLTIAGTDQGLLGIVGAMLSGILAANLTLS
ncbi:MAG: hypothetical protein J6S21_03720, partial [Victivallales bacterium]|nr:hypothetical protein [Victivallales bacterium]